MQIKSATYTDGRLCLEIAAQEGRRFAYDFKPGEYEIKRTKKRRSLDANAYAWVLIHKIAEAVRIPPEDIYRDAIKNIGGVAKVGCFKAQDVETVRKSWESNGLGWQTDVIASKLPDCMNVIFYPGSSVYDTKQMSQLIDLLVQDAQNLDIETLPPEKLEAMKIEWR